jgi:hypothetical protein
MQGGFKQDLLSAGPASNTGGSYAQTISGELPAVVVLIL